MEMCNKRFTFAQIFDACAMNKFSSFNKYVEKSIKANWDADALTDYRGITLQYHDVARKIEKLHILFEYSGIVKGDKIALCGRNSANWAAAMLAILAYGAVAVPVQNEFTPEQIYNTVNHSESRLLFVGDYVGKEINPEEMPQLEGIVNIPDYSLKISRSTKLTYAREHLNELFGKKFPRAFRKDDICYHTDQPEELAILNYTSGTTGFSKGVMLPYRALWGNLDYCLNTIGPKVKPGSPVLSILPMAHEYGMAVEFIFPFIHGCHIYYLTRLPSPAVIAQAFATVHPAIVISVPLIIEKIVRKMIFPKVQNNRVKLLLGMPMLNRKIKEKICQMVRDVFGGNAYEVVVGGAPLNQEVEEFLYKIGFPLTMGYGATECAPLITFSDYTDFVPGSCGLPLYNMEVKILSPDPENIPGEIVARGVNVMLGYYKNEEATRETIDKDGWYHTGDLGTMSFDGHVFIRGRIKNMLLGSNGQNVYPEEIEDKLNSMPMVAESLIIQKGDKLIGLVHPDFDEVQMMGFDEGDMEEVLEQTRKELNAQLPSFSQLSALKIQKQEFAKTPKKSIKRYLYKDIA